MPALLILNNNMQAGKAAKKKHPVSPFKKGVGKIHLWLGLLSGLIVCFLGITGCILAFQREIENVSQPYRNTDLRSEPLLPPSGLKEIAEGVFPGKKLHSISYQPGKSAVATFYNEDPEYYYLVYVDPYSGRVLKAKDMDEDFFRIVTNGHFYLWLPHEIGQPVVASATLIFLFMLITGIILWWPKNKAARKQRFSIKFNARWRRVNYDLHNVLGFYMSWVIIFIALTGLVWGFQWFARSAYWVTSGGKTQVEYTEALSDTTMIAPANSDLVAIDKIFYKVRTEHPGYNGIMDVHIPEHPSSSIEVALNPDEGTYWKTDYLFYDQYTLKEIPVTHSYGKLENAGTADKIARMNYDIHVGAVLGLPGKVMAFFAGLLCASMPVTGFMIWWGRKNKSRKKSRYSLPAARI